MKTIIFFIILALVLLFNGSSYGQVFTVSGKLRPGCSVKELVIKKIVDLFTQQKIAVVPVVDSQFKFSKQLIEPDVYIISENGGKDLAIFIWHTDTYMDLSCNGSHTRETVITNSPLTVEMRQFHGERQKILQPLTDIDVRIEKNKVTHEFNKQQVDSLSKIMWKDMSFYKKKLVGLNLEYVKNHPNSFLSLYILTEYGEENKKEAYRDAFKTLPDTLKNHSRAKIYQ